MEDIFKTVKNPSEALKPINRQSETNVSKNGGKEDMNEESDIQGLCFSQQLISETSMSPNKRFLMKHRILPS